MCSRSGMRRPTSVLILVFLLLLATAPAVLAQSSTAASLEGKASDETGAALPGVTVTLSSPVLQIAVPSQATRGDGVYRFVNLPAGVYQVMFELTGFQTIVREDVRLNAGFAARVDAAMKLGSVEEKVTVTGEGPVVDVSTTVGSTNLTKELLENVPNTRTLWQALAMTPGIRVTGTPDVGGSTVGSQQGFSNYGTQNQTTPEMEGIQTRESVGAAGMYHDYNSMEELLVKPVGSGPESGTPGTNYVVVVKSGSNDFHGRYGLQVQRPALQSNNVDDKLEALGIGRGNPLKYYFDVNADLAGRIVRDKLWFYGAYRNQRISQEQIGYSRTAGVDGVYGTADDEPGEKMNAIKGPTSKLTYQATTKYQLIGFFAQSVKLEPERNGSRFVPFETTIAQRSSQVIVKGEIQGTPTNNVLFNVNVGWHRQYAYFRLNSDNPGNPTRFDRETGLYTGPSDHTTLSYTSQDIIRSRPQSNGSITLFSTGGKHALKTGYGTILAKYGIERFDRASGNYKLIYDRVGGVPFQPVQIMTWNFPILGASNRHTEFYVYAKDDWRVSERLTAQLGVRWERYHNYTVETTKEQGTFGNAGTFPPVEVLTWKSFAPRFGIAWDVTGDARTVVKGTYGLYNHTAGDYFAENYNQNAPVSTTYRWRDLDGNNDYTPGEVNLDLNGSDDFVSITGAANNILNPDLGQPVTHEFSVALERELAANFSGRVLFVNKRQKDLYQAVNVLRPYGAYDIPVTRRDPGPDGNLGTADDGGTVTLFDYNPAFRGATFVGRQFLNHSGRDDSYNTIEVTLNKRPSRNWDMLTSFSATRSHAWIDAIPESPNDEFFPRDETWAWMFKAVGSYRFPYGIRFSTFLQHFSGDPGQRTYIFRNVDPDGGRPLTQLQNVTVRLEPLGSQRQRNINVVHVRGSKLFGLGGDRQLTLDLDVFNVLNANTASTVDFRSGPTYGLISQILPPRIARLGATFSF